MAETEYIQDDYSGEWEEVCKKLELTDGRFDCYYWRMKSDRLYCHKIVNQSELQKHPNSPLRYC